MKQILLADDHNMILSGIKSLLQDDMHTVITVNDMAKLKVALKDGHYDVLLLDIRFGKVDSREHIAELKWLSPNTKIIAITSLDDANSIKSSLATGIDGYLIKSDEVSEIKAAIQAVLLGQTYISKTVKSKYLDTELFNRKQEQIHLTPREKDILRLILEEKTTKEIAETLFLSEKTVENYRGNMMSKLDVKNLAGLVKKAIMDGLLSDG